MANPAGSEFDPPNSVQEALGFDGEHLLRSENIAFDIDNWYPKLKQWTFDSVFLPLSRPEARAIVSYHRAIHMRRGVLQDDAVTLLLRLENRIDRAIASNEHGSFADVGCFMRLCGRSAKDAEPLDRGRVREEYAAALKRAAGTDAGGVQGLSPETKMRAAASVAVLRCWTGAEVMSQILSSERVYSDMLDWMWYGEPEQIVLRRWEPGVSVDMEFRLYVHKNRLCAASQYDHYCLHPHLAGLKPLLTAQIAAIWTEIHPHVGAESYGMDLAYLPEQDRLVFLELSPFLRCTGAHCFRWSSREDVEVLEGRAPFEFRLVEQSAPQFAEMFAHGWERRWIPQDGTPDPPRHWEAFGAAGEPERRRTFKPAKVRAPQHGDGRFVASVPTHHTWPLLQAAIDSVRGAVSTSLALLGLGGLFEAAAGRLGLLDPDPRRHPLFVYGTLKRGMQWHSKFLGPVHHGACFVGTATTADLFPLVVGRCGVPYLLHDRQGTGHHVVGELYMVDSDTLAGLDQYEGLGKHYYGRPTIQVRRGRAEGGVAMNMATTAYVYAMAESPAELRVLPPCSEYTLEQHHTLYRAVEHIRLKQMLYLQGHDQYTRRGVKHPAVAVSDDTGPRREFRPLQPLITCAH